ncbi:IS21-like element helper ATPase IstB [Gayadomonas joobiniege]|uniref:IS21-like element helper ATPase IstB n=1 Tax=Gayadomonas joobiniege TaxID=1234606 RepID=UPI00037803C8|nr:IS21-like element helper ATPase IstB [Gayadomonas joobiniege]
MQNPIPELTPLLKQLRLSGMTETLAQRNREAIAGQLSYPEFLALLIQDEVARRDQKKYASRLRRAGFRSNKTLESFDLNFNPKLNQAMIHELASCQFIEEKVALLIAGPCGTGKSHLAQAIGHYAVQQGYDVAFYTQAKLLSYLHQARATNTYDRRFQTLVKVPLLIIDDFGLKPLKSPQDEDIHDLIDERYERGATIITSNLDFSEWGDAFPNKLLGAATLDRLRHNAYRLILEGESYRSLRHEKREGK